MQHTQHAFQKYLESGWMNFAWLHEVAVAVHIKVTRYPRTWNEPRWSNPAYNTSYTHFSVFVDGEFQPMGIHA